MLSILPLLLLGLILPVFCSITSLPLPEENSKCIEGCFHQPAEFCPSSEGVCRCSHIPNCKKAAICCNVNKFTLTEGLGCGNILDNIAIEALHIQNANLDEFNLTDPVWKKLKYLTVTDGHINKIVGEFPKHTAISCLNFSSNGIQKFTKTGLLNVANLSYIDLSRNNLTDVPKLKKEVNVSLDILENPRMLCTNVQELISSDHVFFENENSTFCLSSQTFHWFNSTDLLAITQVKQVHELETNCVKNCTCIPYRLEYVIGHAPIFSAEVNCSRRGLSSLPAKLPPYTRVLDVSNNNVTSLKELRDPSYKYLFFLYADNNQITSIQPIEGTKFLNNFNKLSLRNNSIKTFETYLLSNIKFYRTAGPRHMQLGLNKLHCDCQTAMEFKIWLLTKVDFIQDYREIMCDNMRIKVIELDQTKLCQGEQDWSDYINYIITAEVLLLISLIAKVSYDYWVFKTAGYLPWPASKMPKLPCDWLCE